jgi:ribulose kinase
VLVKNDFSPVSVCPLGEEDQNVIVWLDHRAVREAEDVNATQHWCLASVGGKVSPEMEIPKLMWLKKNMPQAVAQAEHIMDLADFLSYRATGDVSTPHVFV